MPNRRRNIAMANTAGPNDAQLTAFLNVLNDSANPNYQNAAYLVQTYFCPNGLNPSVPAVGLTDYAPLPAGPIFTFQSAITALFNQLFTAYQGFEFAQQNNSVRLYSLDTTQ